MKKFYILLAILTAAVSFNQITAQNNFNPRFNNLGYVTSKLTYEGVTALRGNGVSFVSGRSYILHPEPIEEMLRFGIDFSWADLNFTSYSVKAQETFNYYQLEYGLHVGPSVHVNPVADLGIHVYFRYAPTFWAILNTDITGFAGGSASYFVSGGAVSWKFISIGAEARWGKGKALFDIADVEDYESDKNKKMKSSGGARIYVSFRF